jgi:hypothetical protein
MPKLIRKGEGKPLRDAMDRAHLTIEELAQATKTVDPTGKGISSATVGNLAGRGKTSRNRCELSTAWFLAEALREPLDDLFIIPAHVSVSVKLKTALRAAKALDIPLQDLVSIPPHSTSTVERSRSDAAHKA